MGDKWRFLRRAREQVIRYRPSVAQGPVTEPAPNAAVSPATAAEDSILHQIHILSDSLHLSADVSPLSRAPEFTIYEHELPATGEAVAVQNAEPDAAIMSLLPLPPPPLFVLRPEDIVTQPPVRIAEVDFVQATQINSPHNRIQVGSRSLTVSGQAEPGTHLLLRIEAFEQGTDVGENGAFQFEGAPLIEGWNTIYVLSLSYPDVEKCHCLVQVYRHALLYVGRRDAYTGSTLMPQDEVVRCQRCRNYARLDSWQHAGCANCRSKRCWTKEDANFYAEDPSIEL